MKRNSTLQNITLGLVFFLLFAPDTFSQTNWATLSQVRLEEPQFISRGYDAPKPVFSDAVKLLEGKEITLSGYIYPLKSKEASHHFVLSALPISSCFFCGNAGPETVAEIRAKHTIPYSTGKIILKGVLKIHHSDPNGLLYTLENAELVN